MGFLSLFDGVERVEVAEGYYVTLKKYLSNDDYTAAQNALLTSRQLVSGGGAADKISAKIDTAGYQQTLLFHAIEAWNLTDVNDVALPLNIDSVKRLPQPTFLLLYGRVTANNKEKETAAEQTSFRDSDNSVGVGQP
jgi:hypothetical protein